MLRYDAHLRRLAIGLSILAGYIDALGFLRMQGLFVSFMSGNSTRLAVGIAMEPRIALRAAGLILAFVLGVMLGTLVAARAGPRRKPAVIGLVTLLLVTAAAADALGAPTVSLAAMVLAMGSANAVFQRDGEVSIGVTYMTGTLVKLGQRLAAALSGGDSTGWRAYLLLWLGLVAGAVLGALLFPYIGLGGLWLAAAWAAMLALYAGRIRPA